MLGTVFSMKSKKIKLETPTNIKSEELVKKRRKQNVWAGMKLFSEKSGRT